jgi:glycosyltransferase involved in cell wall biosynthesis
MLNENKKIAFLTAAFNGEKTLQRTIDSIKSQTHQNFEYFILNDGSSDGTQSIIEENCHLDSRIHSIYFEKNDCQEHFIAALKEILKRDDFDYFAICDHDDEYLPKFAEYTLEAAAKTEADAVFTDILYNSPETGDGIFYALPENQIISTPEEFAEIYAFGLSGIMRTQWGKLFSIEALRETNLDVINIMKYGRDTIFCNEIASNCSTVVFLAMPLYRFYSTETTETNRFEPERINSPAELYKCTYRFITKKCGEYAYQNQDFIYFNYIQDLGFTTHQVINSDLPESLKIDYLITLYSNSVFLDAAVYPNIYNVHIPANNEQFTSFEKLCETAAQAFLSLFPQVNEKQLPAFASTATHTAVLAGYDNPRFPIMGQGPKAVIVTLCHNSGERLRNSIHSVLSQTYWNFDYYLVDNASTDNTREIILETEQNDSRVHHIFLETNEFPGVYVDLIPKILENPDYKYFAICDHDDEMLPRFLETAVREAETESADLVFGGEQYIGTNNVTIIVVDEKYILDTPESFARSLKTFMLYTGWFGILFETDLLKKTDYSSHKSLVLDHDRIFVLDAIKKCKKAVLLPETFFKHYVFASTGSTTPNKKNIKSTAIHFNKLMEVYKERGEKSDALYCEFKINACKFLLNILIDRLIFLLKCPINREVVEILLGYLDEPVFLNELIKYTSYAKDHFSSCAKFIIYHKNEFYEYADDSQKERLDYIINILEKELNELDG